MLGLSNSQQHILKNCTLDSGKKLPLRYLVMTLAADQKQILLEQAFVGIYSESQPGQEQALLFKMI